MESTEDNNMISRKSAAVIIIEVMTKNILYLVLCFFITAISSIVKFGWILPLILTIYVILPTIKEITRLKKKYNI